MPLNKYPKAKKNKTSRLRAKSLFKLYISFDRSYLIWHLQGTTVRVEYGDGTTAIDPSDVHAISRYFPHTYGQPLAHFLRATAKVPDAQIITEHPTIRFVFSILFAFLLVSLSDTFWWLSEC